MKLKRLFSGLLASLVAIVSVLLCVKVSSAEETVTDVLTADMFAATSTTYTAFSDVNGTSGAVYAGKSGKNSAGSIQLRSSGSDCGIVTTTSGGNAKKISVSWDSSTTSGRTLDIYGKTTAYSTAADLYGSSSTQGTKLGSIVYGTSIELDITGTYEYIGLRSNSNAMYLSSISIEWEQGVVATDYNVTFDAGNATFVSGKGEKITTAIGTDTNVTLPTIDDLVYDCKEAMPLAGWSDGTTTHNPGEEVTVSVTTKFTAVYSEDNSKTLSVTEARAVCDLVGNTKTTSMFNVKGIVSIINNTVVVMVDETNSDVSITLYSPSTSKDDLEVGDTIVANGNLLYYNLNTYELFTGCTFENVSTKEDMFQRVQTKTSLSFDWADDGNNYTVSNVFLRFGNLFRASAYDSNALYGLLLIKKDNLGESADFATYLSGMTADQINADENIVYVNATPVRVNANGEADEDGQYYQFAAVLSDMDEYIEEEIVAIMYMVVDGQVYYSVEKSSSVSATAQQYLDKWLDNELELNDDEIETLQILAQYYVGGNE